MSPFAPDVLSTASKDEGNQRFTEWLKWQPLEDYNHVIRLLHKTKQDSLAEQLTASCKVIFIS